MIALLQNLSSRDSAAEVIDEASNDKFKGLRGYDIFRIIKDQVNRYSSNYRNGISLLNALSYHLQWVSWLKSSYHMIKVKLSWCVSFVSRFVLSHRPPGSEPPQKGLD